MKPRLVRIVGHVADGVDMNHRGYDIDHEHHHGSQRVETQRPAYLQRAGIDPVNSSMVLLLP